MLVFRNQDFAKYSAFSELGDVQLSTAKFGEVVNCSPSLEIYLIILCSKIWRTSSRIEGICLSTCIGFIFCANW